VLQNTCAIYSKNKTKERTYKTNGISILKKHVDVKHSLLAKTFNEEVNSSRRTQVER
jgi:hypothetical protein